MQRRGFFGAIAGALAGVASLKLLPREKAPAPVVATIKVPKVERYLVRTTWHRNAGDIPAKFTRIDHYLTPNGPQHIRADVEVCPFAPITPGHFHEVRYV